MQSPPFLTLALPSTACVCLALCILGGCAAVVAQREGVVPPCTECYEGEGEGPTYSIALGAARQALCQDIAVLIRSVSTDTAQHTRRLAVDGSEGFDEGFYQEIVRMVSTTQSNCVFANMPIQEYRSQRGSTTHVLLRVLPEEYAAFLTTRTVSIEVNSSGGDGRIGAALAVVSERLRSQGYLVVQSAPSSRHKARLAVTYALAEPLPEFSGLIVGTASLDWSLVRLESNTELERVHIPGLVERGFTEEVVLQKLDDSVAQALVEYWRNK